MKVLAVPDGHFDGVYALAMDENYIYSGSGDRTVRVWDKNSFKELAVLEGHSEGVYALAVDENYIYSGSGDGIVWVWDKNRFKKLAVLKGHSEGVNALEVDKNYIYSGSGDGIVWVWDKNSFKKLAVLKGHFFGVNALAVDENYIYSGSWDGIVRVWDKNSFEELTVLKGHSRVVNALAVDENYIYSGSGDRTVRIWDKNSYKELAVLKGHSEGVNALAVDENYIYSGSGDRTVRVWDKNSFKKLAVLEGHSRVIYALAVDENYIYSGSRDGIVRVWDKNSFEELTVLKGHFFGVYALAMDENYIYSGSDDNTMRVWDKNSFEELAVLERHSDYVYALAVDKNYIYSGAWDKTVRVWDKNSFEELAVLEGHSEGINALAVDKNYIYSGAWDKTVRVWDKDSYKELAVLKGHSDYVYALAVDENYIYSGAWDKTVRVWDKNSYKELAVLKGHSEGVNALAVDKNYIYSGSKDKTVRVWDKNSFEELAVLEGHSGSVEALAVDENYIYSGSSNGTIFLWNKSNKNLDRPRFQLEMGILNGFGFDYSIFINSNLKVVGNVANNIIGEFDENDPNNLDLLRRVVSGEILPVEVSEWGFRYNPELMSRAKDLLELYSRKRKEDSIKEEIGVSIGIKKEICLDTVEIKPEVPIEEDMVIKQVSKPPSLKQFRCAKLVLVGNGAQGKTTLLNRLMNDEFKTQDEYTETVGLDCVEINVKEMESLVYSSKEIENRVNSEELSLKIMAYDFGGQNRYHYAHQFFFTRNSIILIVFSLREEHMFESVFYWLNLIDNMVGVENVKIGIVGTWYREDVVSSKDINDKREALNNYLDGLGDNLFLVNSAGGKGGAIGYGIDSERNVINGGLVDWIIGQVLRSRIISYGKARSILDECLNRIIKEQNIKIITLGELKQRLEVEAVQKYGIRSWNDADLISYLEDIEESGKIMFYKFDDRRNRELDSLVVLEPGWVNKFVFYFRKYRADYLSGIDTRDGIIESIRSAYNFNKKELGERGLSLEFISRFCEYMFKLLMKYKIIIDVGANNYILADAVEKLLIEKTENIERELENLPENFDEIKLEWDGFILGVSNVVFRYIKDIGQFRYLWTEEKKVGRIRIIHTNALYKIGTDTFLLEIINEKRLGGEIPYKQQILIRVYSLDKNITKILSNYIRKVGDELGINIVEVEADGSRSNVRSNMNLMRKIEGRLIIKEYNRESELTQENTLTNEILNYLKELKSGQSELKRGQRDMYRGLDGIQEGIREMRRDIESGNEKFKSLLELVIEKLNILSVNCPRLITVQMVKKKGFSLLKFYERVYRADFYCENCYEKYSITFKMMKDWVKKIVPILKIIVNLINHINLGYNFINVEGEISDKFIIFIDNFKTFADDINSIYEEINKLREGNEEKRFIEEIIKNDSKIAGEIKNNNPVLIRELCEFINSHEKLSGWKDFLTYDSGNDKWICKKGCNL